MQIPGAIGCWGFSCSWIPWRIVSRKFTVRWSSSKRVGRLLGYEYCYWTFVCKSPHALKGQKLLAQGNALGIRAISKTPWKGKSFVYCLVLESFCPYRATGLHPSLPRVLPWARSFCPFRACGGGAYLSLVNNITNLRKSKLSLRRKFSSLKEKYIFP